MVLCASLAFKVTPGRVKLIWVSVNVSVPCVPWNFLTLYPWRIHGARYGVPWIPSIYPSHVSIFTSTMDPMGYSSLHGAPGNAQQRRILSFRWKSCERPYGGARARQPWLSLGKVNYASKSEKSGVETTLQVSCFSCLEFKEGQDFHHGFSWFSLVKDPGSDKLRWKIADAFRPKSFAQQPLQQDIGIGMFPWYKITKTRCFHLKPTNL